MKHIKSAIAVLTIVFSSAPCLAGDMQPTLLGERLAHRNCSWCHGSSGQGFATAPRLAGQRRQYIEQQLLSFRNHTRDNPKSEQYMWGAAATIGPRMARDLADYYSTLIPRAARDGNERLAARGEALYKDGNPAANIPSCVACHGPNAEGIGPIPRLGGLSHRYLRRKLEQWGEGYHAAAAVPMPGVASKLSADDIEAVASYLSFVR
jgi:cytochrome c553